MGRGGTEQEKELVQETINSTAYTKHRRLVFITGFITSLRQLNLETTKHRGNPASSVPLCSTPHKPCLALPPPGQHHTTAKDWGGYAP